MLEPCRDNQYSNGWSVVEQWPIPSYAIDDRDAKFERGAGWRFNQAINRKMGRAPKGRGAKRVPKAQAFQGVGDAPGKIFKSEFSYITFPAF